ncbi:restriction endonuclease subunit S [Nostoc sp. FACHB-133]|uniref:restriction endonuclease subunit S n=1 Tax=Nostoc sp. FACHB-133 TaxID=2692835 RepID=UPI0016838761|nr:restriction endonuclease subunit S [Nostoc sp. FACHB-133]MBD2526788.1 restriction endonuclease subunit S [Nostoc sp. FACHB-133]
MAFPKYESYKYSEVAELGKIPSHWKVLRNRYLFIEPNERSLTGNETHLMMSQKLGLIPSSVEAKTLQSESYEGAKLCLKNDIVLNRLKAHLGVFSVAPCNGLVSPDYSIFRLINSKMEPKYFEHLFKTPTYISELNRKVKGIVVGFYRLYSEEFNDIVSLCPPIEEQQRIVAFLERTTAEIDEAISKKQRLIKLLQEQKAVIINQAVTQGINPKAPMRESGVEWIGEVPEHWEIIRTKNIFRLVTEPAPKNNSEELLSVYSDIGVKPRKELEERGNKASTTDGYWFVKKGDIIVNKLLAWMGAIGVSEYDGVTSPAYDILRASKPVDSKFYHYLFRNPICTSKLKQHSKGIMEMRLRLYFDEFGNIKIPYPPFEEQQRIVAFIDRTTAEIDEVIAQQYRVIETLKEFKQILISNAVTGEIKV